ncbi:MAG: hypothetical protein NHG07_00545 [Candidatus Shikimatogenerans bostrichidophilus]|nr:MAG: hypothetical protein NHG07_00545 [Candidatus Shikimatogenerans bostrichidophilus]
MIKNLIINVKKRQILIALLENSKLVELYRDIISDKEEILIGDIFIGRIKLISKGMNAVFVDIGYIKYGFLHFNNLIININNKIFFYEKKKKKILNLLK